MKLTDEDIEKIHDKTNNGCFWCGNASGKLDFHHVIFKNKVQGGTDHPENLVLACSAMVGCKVHNEIHSGLNSQGYVLASYKFLPEILDNCWSGKIKPKKINEIEFDRLSELF